MGTNYSVYCPNHPSYYFYRGGDESRFNYWKKKNCWDVCPHCIKHQQLEDSKYAEETIRHNMESINERKKLLDDLENELKTLTEKNNKTYRKLEENVKQGIYDESINFKIEVNSLSQFEKIAPKITNNLLALAKDANKCAEVGEQLEKVIGEFERGLNDNNVLKQTFVTYKIRAEQMKSLKNRLTKFFNKINLEKDSKKLGKEIEQFENKNKLNNLLSILGDQYGTYLKLFEEKGIKSVEDLFDLEQEDLAYLGVENQIHAIKIKNCVKSAKNNFIQFKKNALVKGFTQMSKELNKLSNSIKTVKKAFEETEKDFERFLEICNNLLINNKEQLNVADGIDLIANNLLEIKKYIITSYVEKRTGGIKKGSLTGATICGKMGLSISGVPGLIIGSIGGDEIEVVSG